MTTRAVNPGYVEEPPTEVIVNGVRCVSIDGARIVQLDRDYRMWGIK